MLVTFSQVVNPTSLTLSQTVGLAACDTKALYAVQQETVGFTLWFSNDSGQKLGEEATAGMDEIACDHSAPHPGLRQQALQRAAQRERHDRGMDRANREHHGGPHQGGDGTFYGVKRWARATKFTWRQSRHGCRPHLVRAHRDDRRAARHRHRNDRDGHHNLAVSNSLAWPRRAYALEANGTMSMNDTLLAGANLWTGLNTGSERYTVLTAAAPNMLYGLQTRNGVRELDQITMKETDCTDTVNGVAVDNDANGLRNSEDPACKQVVASAYCTAHGNGRYCADRYQPATFLDQTNQNTSL
jgi:hypothetical protein